MHSRIDDYPSTDDTTEHAHGCRGCPDCEPSDDGPAVSWFSSLADGFVTMEAAS